MKLLKYLTGLLSIFKDYFNEKKLIEIVIYELERYYGTVKNLTAFP